MPIVSYTKCGCVEFSTKVLLRVIQLNVIFRHLTSQKLLGIWTCMKMSKNVFYLLLQGWDTILSSCQDYCRVFLASAPVNCKLIDKWSSNPQKSLYLSRIWGKQFILNPQHTEQEKTTFPLPFPLDVHIVDVNSSFGALSKSLLGLQFIST